MHCAKRLGEQLCCKTEYLNQKQCNTSSLAKNLFCVRYLSLIKLVSSFSSPVHTESQLLSATATNVCRNYASFKYYFHHIMKVFLPRKTKLFYQAALQKFMDRIHLRFRMHHKYSVHDRCSCWQPGEQYQGARNRLNDCVHWQRDMRCERSFRCPQEHVYPGCRGEVSAICATNLNTILSLQGRTP